MDIFKWTIIFGFLKCIISSKVYEWRSEWGLGLSTRELAQVHDSDQTIIHYAADEGAPSKSAPAISLYDFQFTSADFKEGILAIRPLISDGNQLCFISQPSKSWTKSVNKVSKRHGTVLSAPTSFNFFELKESFPADMDPLSVQSVADFCNVDSKHMFYMDPVKSVKNMTKMKIHGLYGRLTVGIPDNLINSVFDFKDDHNIDSLN